jgi:hypothetical protein
LESDIFRDFSPRSHVLSPDIFQHRGCDGGREWGSGIQKHTFCSAPRFNLLLSSTEPHSRKNDALVLILSHSSPIRGPQIAGQLKRSSLGPR